MGKLGLVFGGGGARGAYEIGVWMALEDLGIRADIVVGTSIGALNGALYAQQDLDVALEIWNHMSPEVVMKDGMNLDTDLDLLMSQRHQFELFIKQFIQRKSVDISPLKDLIQRCAKEEVLRTSPIRFGLCTLEVPRNIPHLLSIDEIPEGKAADYLLASASCFPVFPICEIEGRYFIDGGYYDNVPIQLAKRMGADEFIVVELKSRPRLDSKHRHYRNVTYISPYYDLNSFLNFDGEIARNNIRLGYLDAMKRFHRLIGYVYSFYPAGISADNCYIQSFFGIQKALQEIFDQHPRIRFFFHRLTQTRIRNAIVFNEDMEELALAVRFCEITGEVLLMDRLNVYDFISFNQELWHRFQNALSKPQQTILRWREIRSQLRLIDPVSLTVFFYHQIQELLNGSKGLEENAYLMTLQRDEIIAAIYLSALQKCRK